MLSMGRIVVLLLAGAVSTAAWGQSFAPPEATARPAPVPAWSIPVDSSQGVRPAAYETPSPASAAPTASGTAMPAAPELAGPRGQPAAVPLPAHKGDSGSSGEGAAHRSERASRSNTPSLVTVVGSLTVVVGLFLLVMWGMRRTMPGQVATLPKEVVDVLGRAALASRQQVYLLRCGSKLLLVSVTPAGVETLTEIEDAPEVDRLLGLCAQARPDSTTAAFRQFFQQFAQEPSGSRSRPANVQHSEPLDGGYSRGDRAGREDRRG